MEGAAGGSSSAGQREFADGCKLQIKTTFGEVIEGHVLTYDKGTNILVLHILFLFFRLGLGSIIARYARRESFAGD